MIATPSGAPTVAGSTAAAAVEGFVLPPAVATTHLRALFENLVVTEVGPAAVCVGFVVLLICCHAQGGLLYFCWGNFERAYCCCGCWYSRYLRVAGGSHREWVRAQFRSAKMGKRRRRKEKAARGKEAAAAAPGGGRAKEKRGGGSQQGAPSGGSGSTSADERGRLRPLFPQSERRFAATLTCLPRRAGQVGGGANPASRNFKTTVKNIAHVSTFTIAVGHVNAPDRSAIDTEAGTAGGALLESKQVKRSIGSLRARGCFDPDGAYSLVGIHTFLTSAESPGRIAMTQRYACSNALAACEFRGALVAEDKRQRDEEGATHVFRGTWYLQDPRQMLGVLDEGDFALVLRMRG